MAKSVNEYLTELAKCREAYTVVFNSMNEITTHMNMLKTELQEVCPHDETETHRETYAGSYLNKGYTDYITKCKTCEKKLAERTEMGYYG